MIMIDPLAVVGALNKIRIRVQDVKVYKRRCNQLALHCALLISTLREAGDVAGMDANYMAQDLLEKVRRQIDRWARLGLPKSLLMLSEINETINSLNQDIDRCMQVYQVSASADLKRAQEAQRLAAARDSSEMLNVLHSLSAIVSRHLAGTETPSPVTKDVVQNIEEAVIQDREGPANETTSEEEVLEEAMRRFTECTSVISANQVQGSIMPNVESSLYKNGGTFGGNPSVKSFRSVLGGFSSSKAPHISASFLKLDEDVDAFFRTGEFKSRLPTAHQSSSVLSPPRPGSSDSADTLLNTPLQTRMPLEQALSNNTSIFTETHDGQLASGTLEGLVEYLLFQNANSTCRDVFLVTYSAFTLPRNLLNILIRQSRRTEIKSDQYMYIWRMTHIMNLLICWLENTDAFIDWDTLTQINEFVVAVEGPHEVVKLALHAANAISERTSLNSSLSRSNTSFGHRLPSVIPKPEEVAVALAVLEGRTYRSLLSSECIAYVRGHGIGSQSVQRACDLNKQISNWVKQSILISDDYDQRADMETFFVKAAEHCLKIRNFSSLAAIVGALQCKTISRLEETHRKVSSKKRTILEKLGGLVAPTGNYAAYRMALTRCRNENQSYVPWLMRHLDDIKIELQQADVLKFVNDSHSEVRFLLNFDQWRRLCNGAREALNHRPVDGGSNEAVVGILTSKLRSICIDSEFDESLEVKSKLRRKQERVLASKSKTQTDEMGWG